MLKNITVVSLLLFSTALYAETLDEAIKRFVPAATDTIADVAPTEEILVQAKTAVKTALLVDPDNESIKSIAELLETIVAGEVISEEDREELISQLAAFATANSAVYNSAEQHLQINDAIQATIAILPTKMELLAFPTEVKSGGYSNLMWVATQKNCQIAGMSVVAAGNMRVGPLSNNSQFTLSCSNGLGQISQKTVSIRVSTPKPAVTERPVTSEPLQNNKSPKPQGMPQTVEYPVGVLKAVSATASGFQKLSNGESYTALNAIDGDLSKNSRWSQKGISPNVNDSEWIALDLGAERKLNTLRIAFYKYDQGRIYDYDIAVSRDNKNWKTVVKNAKSAASRWTSQSFKAEIGQYVKVIINSASDGSSWANLFEIEVLNKDGGAVPKKVTLKWNASKGGAEGYKVYFGTTKENTGETRIRVLKDGSKGFNKSAPSITFDPVSDLGVSEGGQVCFSLRAINGAGQSDMSKPVCGIL